MIRLRPEDCGLCGNSQGSKLSGQRGRQRWRGQTKAGPRRRSRTCAGGGAAWAEAWRLAYAGSRRGCCSEGAGLIRTILTKRGWLTRAASREAGSYRRIMSPEHGLSKALPLPAPALHRDDRQKEGTSFPASVRNSTCLRIRFPKHLLASESLVSRRRRGNGGTPKNGGTRFGWEWLFRATHQSSSGAADNSEVSSPGATPRAFWKHTPSPCSEIQDPRRSRRRRRQRGSPGKTLKAQLIQPPRGADGKGPGREGTPPRSRCWPMAEPGSTLSRVPW